MKCGHLYKCRACGDMFVEEIVVLEAPFNIVDVVLLNQSKKCVHRCDTLPWSLNAKLAAKRWGMADYVGIVEDVLEEDDT